ncbi:MAG: hypothetical protein ACXW0Q_01775 [Methylovulum sp.]
MPKRYIPLLFLMSGCTSINQTMEADSFDYKSVAKISFHVHSELENKDDSSNEQTFLAISREISQRFAAAGYPVVSFDAEAIANNGQIPASHVMEAVIEETQLTATPAGFSFDFGNSDPRAANFQKTLSAPITCTLRSRKDPSQQISLKELKSISTDIESITLNGSAQAEKLKRFYIENVGSTCHNLLNRLQVKPVAGDKVGKATEAVETFLPAIRVETKYKTDVPAPKAQQPKPSNAKPSIETPILEKPVQPQPPSITTRENGAETWQNKEMTIFNQGNTVILEFGNDRNRQ